MTPFDKNPKDPLHGITLEAILTQLVKKHGWGKLSRNIPVRCFMFNPTIKSSLTFLRKTPWARQRLEEWYISELPRPARAAKGDSSPARAPRAKAAPAGENVERGFKIIPFDPLTASDELWTLYFDHTEEIYREHNPDDPMLPRAKKKELTLSSLPSPYVNTYILLALTEDGRAAAGVAHTMVENRGSPTYADNKHIGNLRDLSVSKAYRGRGLGNRLLRGVLEEMAAKEPQVTELHICASLEPGHRFLEKKGATVSLVHAENRLYLNDLDWAMVERWEAEGIKRNPDTEILMVSVIPEEDLRDYAAVYTETINQQPLGELALRMEITPEQIRYGEKKSREQGSEHTAIYTREKDGRVSGLTDTSYLKELGHVVHQMLTGVRKEYRGRGLGKLLKARMLLHIRKAYPGVKYIVTGNADSNAPMMAINNALGFKKHRPVLIYKLKTTPELRQA